MAEKKVNEKFNFKKVTGFADIFKRSEKNESEVILFPNAETKKHKWYNMFEMLCHACEVYRDGWKPDYTNMERKWYPIPIMKSDGSGFALLGSVYVFAYSFSLVGPRLSFPSEEMSDHFFKTFEKEINFILMELQ